MAPPGALAPGTRLTVGSHHVAVRKYISEGGFAHVYVVTTDRPAPDGSDVACLKRVVVPDKTHLNLLRAEVDAMKRLSGHKNIVRYMDSHAARLPSGPGYEVMVLMEYCSGNGLIDYMNARLKVQLTESEILQIMADISQGLACMHYLQPPLIHRDLKIENVLIAADGTFKLCDFGSASPVLRPPRNATELQILDQDIQRHTTVQYRAPEMIDLYRGFPIDEKCDMWALGVFLYKLCYYTTPFERDGGGHMAILHARFAFPPHPAYSDRLKRIVSACLAEDPRHRPNVYQVLKEVCAMRGVEVPIKDVYVSPVATAADRQPQLQPVPPAQPPAVAVANAVSQAVSVAQAQAPAQAQAVAMAQAVSQAQAVAVAASIGSSLPSSQTITPEPSRPPSTPAKPVPIPGNSLFDIDTPDDAFAFLGSQTKTGNSSKSAKSAKSAKSLDLPAITNSSTGLTAFGRSPERGFGSPDDDLAAKYPTVEQLTQTLEQTFSFETVNQSPDRDADRSRLMSRKSAPALRQFEPALDQSAAKSQPQLKLPDSPGQASIDSSSSGSSYDVVRPRQASGPASGLASGARRPVSMYLQPSQSLVDLDGDYDDTALAPTLSAQTHQHTLIDSTQAEDERDELKKILTGISEMSDAMVLDDDTNHIDSNVDFLRTLSHDPSAAQGSGSGPGSASQSRRTSGQTHSRKPSQGATLSLGNSIRRTTSAASNRHRHRPSMSSLKGKLGDAFRMFDRDRDELTATTPPSAAASPDLSLIDNGRFDDDGRKSSERVVSIERKLDRRSLDRERGSVDRKSLDRERQSLDRERKSLDRERKSFDRERPLERAPQRQVTPQHQVSQHQVIHHHTMPQTTAQTTAQHQATPQQQGASPAPTFAQPLPVRRRTTNSIQNRMQQLLSRKNSPPPRKTAVGYGKYTDEDGQEIDRQVSVSTGSSTNNKKPAVPSKPRHLQSPSRTPDPTAPTAPTAPTGSTGPSGDDWELQFNAKYPSLH